MPGALTRDQARGTEELAGKIKQETGVDVRVQFAREQTGRDKSWCGRACRSRPPVTRGQVLQRQADDISALMAREYPGVKAGGAEMVSPVVSQELIWNAIYSVLLGCVFILGWIRSVTSTSSGPSPGWSRCCTTCWLLLGVFALTQREVNSPFVAAALTVVGFSVHDTIVIFDPHPGEHQAPEGSHLRRDREHLADRDAGAVGEHGDVDAARADRGLSIWRQLAPELHLRDDRGDPCRT